jgi:hypothetical protein
MLTLKENYLMTLRGEQPEWIPIFTFGKRGEGSEPVASQRFMPPILSEHSERGGGKDLWGVNGVTSGSVAYGLVPEPGDFILSLDTLKNWRDIIKAPDISNIDWDRIVKAQLDQAGVDRKQTAVELGLHLGYFQYLMAFMGFEEGLIAFYEEPELIKELLEYLSNFYMTVADKVIDLYKPDILVFTDDTAAWGNPFISVDMYREFVLPYHMKWSKRARDRGLLMTMHNCGKCEGVIDMFIEMGINVWDPAQTCNDIAAIKKKYGNKLVICGAWDARGRLLESNVTEEEIRQSVRDTCDKYAVGGGFCWSGGFLGAVNDAEAARKNKILNDEVEIYTRDFYKTH